MTSAVTSTNVAAISSASPLLPLSGKKLAIQCRSTPGSGSISDNGSSTIAVPESRTAAR